MVDVAVIGAGVTGAMIARELCAFERTVCIVERGADIAVGATKANSSIVHAGYDAKPGSLKAELNVAGNQRMESVAKELDVPYKRTGSMVLAFEQGEIETLKVLMEQGQKNGVTGLHIIDRERILEMEPNVSPEVLSALYAPTAGLVSPYELTVGAMENAVQNGAILLTEFEVRKVSRHNGKDPFYTLEAADGRTVQARVVVNAAGIYGDAVANLFGDESFSIRPRKGEYVLFDKADPQPVRTILFQTPTKMGKGILITPTLEKNLLVGPTAVDVEDKEDVSTSDSGIQKLIAGGLKSVPSLNFKQVIASFSGLRAVPSTGDFIIGHSEQVKNLIHAVGIESPGLTASPAIGKRVAELVSELFVDMKRREDFNPIRQAIPRFQELSEAQRAEFAALHPAYGNIVCRCELVTEAEIVASIRRPAGARNLDAVKRRTRAGGGRCQGGFCSPKVVHLLARELGISPLEVTKKGGASRLLFESRRGEQQDRTEGESYGTKG